MSSTKLQTHETGSEDASEWTPSALHLAPSDRYATFVAVRALCRLQMRMRGPKDSIYRHAFEAYKGSLLRAQMDLAGALDLRAEEAETFDFSMKDPGLGHDLHWINFKTSAVLKHEEFEEAFYDALERTTILEELSKELGRKVEIRRINRR